MGRDQRFFIKSNLVALQMPPPQMAYLEGYQYYFQGHCHPQCAGTPRDFILRALSGREAPEELFQKPDCVDVQLKSHYPHNKIQVHLQGLQNPTPCGCCLVFKPLSLSVPLEPPGSPSSSSNSLEVFSTSGALLAPSALISS